METSPGAAVGETVSPGLVGLRVFLVGDTEGWADGLVVGDFVGADDVGEVDGETLGDAVHCRRMNPED